MNYKEEFERELNETKKTRNAFFVGFFYVALGMFLSHKENLSLSLLLVTALLGFVGIIMGVPRYLAHW